jgi:hypothetical protein
VALLNLGYFTIEFGVARAIGSVSLFADSIDFLEDATVNGLILIALGWSARRDPFVPAVSSNRRPADEDRTDGERKPRR